MPQQHKGLTHPGGGRAAPGQDERYFAQHPGVVSLRTLPAPQHDVLAFLAVVPQQPFASAQQAAPDLQQACAPEQHDLTWAQQSLPWAQQPSLTVALQQAEPLSQQASFLPQQSFTLALQQEPSLWQQDGFLPQQSFTPASAADGTGAANNTEADRAANANRLANMIVSTNRVLKTEIDGQRRGARSAHEARTGGDSAKRLPGRPSQQSQRQWSSRRGGGEWTALAGMGSAASG